MRDTLACGERRTEDPSSQSLQNASIIGRRDEFRRVHTVSIEVIGTRQKTSDAPMGCAAMMPRRCTPNEV